MKVQSIAPINSQATTPIIGPPITRLMQDGRQPGVAKPWNSLRREMSSLDSNFATSWAEGAFARVFVAEQADLADRPVVLKFSRIEGIEPQTLSRLQHTHIVPIYSVHEDPQERARAVCMPYFGGANLASVLERLWSRNDRPTQGIQLVEALQAEHAKRRNAVASHRGAKAQHPTNRPNPGPILPSGELRLHQGRGLGHGPTRRRARPCPSTWDHPP